VSILVVGIAGMLSPVCVFVQDRSGTMCCCRRSVHYHRERLILIRATTGELRTSDLSLIITRSTSP